MSESPSNDVATELNGLSTRYREAFSEKYASFYDKHITGKVLAHQMTIEEYRTMPPTILSFGVLPGPDSADLKDIEIPVSGGHITLRIYSPKGLDMKNTSKLEEKRPAYLNVHGGGWVIGGLDDDKPFLLSVVAKTGAIVIDVGYRLAPDHKYPTGILDGWESFKWVVDHAEELEIDKKRIAVGGFSAGGHIAAVIGQLARDEKMEIRPCFQLLVIPVTDASGLDSDLEVKEDCPYESWKEHHDAPFLSHARMSWFYRYFLPEKPSAEILADPLLSPLRAKSLADLPPALVVPAEIDVLRDEGIAYARRLAKENSSAFTELYLAKGVPHPFCHQLDATPVAVKFREKALQRLEEAFTGHLPEAGFISNI